MVARVLFFFPRLFLHTFIIVTCFSRTIFIFVISVPNFPLLCTCTYIFVSNIHTIKIYIVWIQVIFSNITKIPYVHVDEPEQFRTTCALGFSFPNIFKFLVRFCACAFVSRLSGVFATLINVKKTVTYIHGLLILVIKLTQSVFMGFLLRCCMYALH